MGAVSASAPVALPTLPPAAPSLPDTAGAGAPVVVPPPAIPGRVLPYPAPARASSAQGLGLGSVGGLGRSSSSSSVFADLTGPISRASSAQELGAGGASAPSPMGPQQMGAAVAIMGARLFARSFVAIKAATAAA
jgi:hypothetical protein